MSGEQEQGATKLVPIGDIVIGERHRTDLGDVAALALSMKEVGQLQPVVITPGRRLIAGERRIAAARSLGWTSIDAKVADNLTDVGLMLQAEAEENTCRKAFTPTEAESIARAREEWLAPLAEQAKAQAAGKPRGEKAADFSSAKFAEETRPDRPAADRQTRKIAANGTGYSHATLAKVREVKEAAADPAKPEPVREAARQALANMDRSGKVAGEHKRVKIAEQAAESSAVNGYLAADKALQLSNWNRAFLKAICRITELPRFQPEDVAEKATEENLTELREAITQMNRYVQRIEELRPKGLRVVNGGSR